MIHYLTAILVTGDASHAITIYGKEDMNYPGMYKYVCYDSNYRNENTYLYVMENNGFFQYYYKASLYDYQYATGNDNYGLLVYDKNLNML